MDNLHSLGTIDGVGDGVERVTVTPFPLKVLDRDSNGGVCDVGNNYLKSFFHD